jgi:hypothetical protein
MAEAFAPHTSFIGRPLVAMSPSATTTCLQMNLFDRFARVAKSNLNNILQSLEDPEKIMNQALEDMQVRARVCVVSISSVTVCCITKMHRGCLQMCIFFFLLTRSQK